jgi:hypothetical protein
LASREGIVALEGVEAAIVLMHPVARRDVGRGEADDLAELADRLVLGDRAQRHLVAARDALQRGDAGSGHAEIDGSTATATLSAR